MRISDWSSDVCSSDLAGAQFGMRDMLTASDSEGMVRAALADAADMPIEVTARQFCACATEVACGSYCTPDQVAPYYVAVSTIADEIGRASCRERCLQYG